MRFIYTAILIAAISGCATNKSYMPQPWARMSYPQANAYCKMEIQKNPMLGFDTCLDAQGWHPVYQ